MAGKNSHTESHGMKDMGRKRRSTDILMAANRPQQTAFLCFSEA